MFFVCESLKIPAADIKFPLYTNQLFLAEVFIGFANADLQFVIMLFRQFIQ
jgi:hypothetical protein